MIFRIRIFTNTTSKFHSRVIIQQGGKLLYYIVANLFNTS